MRRIIATEPKYLLRIVVYELLLTGGAISVMGDMDFRNRLGLLIRKEGLELISDAYVALSGLGGVGGVAFQALVRSGVRRFRLAENGIFDPPDMNRQPGATLSTIGRKKLEVYDEWARSINPNIELQRYDEGINIDNIEEFLHGTDVYIGAIDVEKGQDVKDKGADIARKYCIPLFTSGVVGFGALMVNHHPAKMTPAEFWNKALPRGGKDGLGIYADHFQPEIISRLYQGVLSGTVPSTTIGVNLAGTVVANEVINYFLQPLSDISREPLFAPNYLVIDLSNFSMTTASIED